jgi:DNA helicase-2/ATP-dependent DNA helicase PcrA
MEAGVTRTFKVTGPRREAGASVRAELNEQQRAVVDAAGGPMLVVAGAGTGKTRTLTCRLARLIEDGVDPRRLLLVTFTNRAAREMLHRVAQLVRHDTGAIWGGTFHHVANRVLRRHGAALGLGPDFTILDAEDAADLLAACVAELGIRITRRRFPAKALLRAIASAVANTDRTLIEMIGERHPTFLPVTTDIERVLDRYSARKRSRQLLDYDDLLTQWLRLLETCPAVDEELSERFLHIRVDEYQDTNAIQARIVDRLGRAHRNVCVVGDDAQSIYGFRGARHANIMGFQRRYPDATTYRLEVNYRSTPEIVALANASIAQNVDRLPKTLRAVRRAGLTPAQVPCADHFAQSRFIAAYILQLLDEGRSLFDIAVLYRSHWHAMEIQLELQRRDVPFTVRGGLRFFEQAHIKDVLSLLRLRHNPHDELAWQRALRLVPRIGGAIAQRLWQEIATADDPLAAARSDTVRAALPPVARASYERFDGVLDTLASADGPAAQLLSILDDFYREILESRYENAALREQDIRGVIDFAGQYRTVEAFLSDVALAGDFDGETCVDGPEEQEFVTLTTVHQAKGLEWPVVLIPWVSDGRFPTDMAMGTPEELEEERRVFHVALTRARDELYLIVPQVWSNHRQRRILMKPSRFLTELEGKEVVETMVIEDEEGVVTAGESHEPPTAPRTSTTPE